MKFVVGEEVKININLVLKNTPDQKDTGWVNRLLEDKQEYVATIEYIQKEYEPKDFPINLRLFFPFDGQEDEMSFKEEELEKKNNQLELEF